MSVQIARNIKRLRHSRELTQEKLADILGVSAQAISKWENGDNYPDMELLPAIANYFAVSVDDLLGMNEIRDTKRIEDAKAKTLDLQLNQNYGSEEILNIWRELARDMPHNWEVQMLYADNLDMYKNRLAINSAEDIISRQSQIIPIFERILENCTDDDIRSRTIAKLSQIYCDRGDIDKAREYANRLPSAANSREWANENIALHEIMRYSSDNGLTTRELQKNADPEAIEKLLEPYKTALELFSFGAQNALHNLRVYRKTYGLITNDEYIKSLELDKAAYSLMFMDQPERYADALQGCCLDTMHAYLENGDIEHALDCIESYVDMSVQKPWSEMVSVRSGGTDDEGNYIQKHYEQSVRLMPIMMLQDLPESTEIIQKIPAERLRGNPRFIAAMAKLREGEPITT
ncbi:MAG: helix-turn-helix domain-containing protein [Oscillospiraceae bacterium]|jgi:transcriptional regulator with XRE-family HTH domain|nr:helix-turn-helix domain-containing protein [Oscillospiraceae bacterium]